MPNCKLVLKEGVPLGEHCLVVKSIRPIKEGKQWLLNYGPLHKCGVKRQKRRTFGRAEAGGAEDAEDAVTAAQGGA